MTRYMLLFMLLLAANSAQAGTYNARCELSDDQAIAWVTNNDNDLELSGKAILRVYDNDNHLLYRDTTDIQIKLDAFDSEKIFIIGTSTDATYCELTFESTSVVVHEYKPATTIVYEERLSSPPPLVIYKYPKPRTQIVIKKRQPEVRVYKNHDHRPTKRIIIREKKPQTRIRISPMRVSF